MTKKDRVIVSVDGVGLAKEFAEELLDQGIAFKVRADPTGRPDTWAFEADPRVDVSKIVEDVRVRRATRAAVASATNANVVVEKAVAAQERMAVAMERIAASFDLYFRSRA